MTEQKQAVATQIATRRTTLSVLEERVIRMRHGLAVPEQAALEHLGHRHPELTRQLTAIEKQALSMVGTRTNESKRKIIASLRRLARRPAC